MLAPEASVRRSHSAPESFGTKRFWRRARKRVAEYPAHFDESVNQLRDDGVVETLEPILGWFCLQVLARPSERGDDGAVADLHRRTVVHDSLPTCTGRGRRREAATRAPRT